MDLDTFVMTAASAYGVRAVSAEEFSLAVTPADADARLSAIVFATAAAAQRLADACMAEGLPARAYGQTTVVLS